MVMIGGSGAAEGEGRPTEQELAAMTSYNEELVKAGIMLDGAGLKPTSAGAKVVFEPGGTCVVDGPFTEAKEIIGGYWIWQVSSLEEAVEWARRCPIGTPGRGQFLEIRPYVEVDDFGDAYTDEIRAREAKIAEEIASENLGH
jgi:hypothetical protein